MTFWELRGVRCVNDFLLIGSLELNLVRWMSSVQVLQEVTPVASGAREETLRKTITTPENTREELLFCLQGNKVHFSDDQNRVF